MTSIGYGILAYIISLILISLLMAKLFSWEELTGDIGKMAGRVNRIISFLIFIAIILITLRNL